MLSLLLLFLWLRLLLIELLLPCCSEIHVISSILFWCDFKRRNWSFREFPHVVILLNRRDFRSRIDSLAEIIERGTWWNRSETAILLVFWIHMADCVVVDVIYFISTLRVSTSTTTVSNIRFVSLDEILRLNRWWNPIDCRFATQSRQGRRVLPRWLRRIITQLTDQSNALDFFLHAQLSEIVVVMVLIIIIIDWSITTIQVTQLLLFLRFPTHKAIVACLTIERRNDLLLWLLLWLTRPANIQRVLLLLFTLVNHHWSMETQFTSTPWFLLRSCCWYLRILFLVYLLTRRCQRLLCGIELIRTRII